MLLIPERLHRANLDGFKSSEPLLILSVTLFLLLVSMKSGNKLSSDYTSHFAIFKKTILKSEKLTLSKKACLQGYKSLRRKESEKIVTCHVLIMKELK